MGDCSRTKILTGLVVCFAIACVILVGALVWRERSRPETTDTSLTSEAVNELYPGLFRTPEEQREYEAMYLNSFYNDRKVVNVTVPQRNSTCDFSCGPVFGKPERKKRAIQQIYHGCCVSSVAFVTPDKQKNTVGKLRTLVQLSKKQQYFALHTCIKITPCYGCSCSQESNLYTAVVVKNGVKEPDDIEDTEIDFFFLDGCCKCVNN